MAQRLTVEQHYGCCAQKNKGVRALSKWATVEKNWKSACSGFTGAGETRARVCISVWVVSLLYIVRARFVSPDRRQVYSLNISAPSQARIPSVGLEGRGGGVGVGRCTSACASMFEERS